MTEVAMGVIILNRVDKLEGLLDSAVDKGIDTVYIADNGESTDEKAELYEKTYPFPLEVLDLEYDIGLGYCRNKIVEKCDEEYLLMADSDHQLSNNIDMLLNILREKESIGGVAGSIIEPSIGRIWQSAKDFRLIDRILIKGNVFEHKTIEVIDGIPFVEFDFVPYPTLYKVKCLADYAWDPNIRIGFAHSDYYVHHWMHTDWKFGITPEVCFRHYPGGDEAYSVIRHDRSKSLQSKKYFMEKWELEDFRTDGGYWYDTRYRNLRRPLHQRIVQTYDNSGFEGLLGEILSKAKYELKKMS